MKPIVTGVLRLDGRDLKPESELERLLGQSVREAEIEREHGAKFVRSCDIPSDFMLSELHAELDRVVTR